MPTHEEKKAAIEQIRRYCKEYSGKKQAFFNRLLDSLEAVEGIGEYGEVRIDAQYRTAISALLSLIDRPSTDTLTRVLTRINERTNMSFHDVELVGGLRTGVGCLNCYASLQRGRSDGPRSCTRSGENSCPTIRLFASEERVSYGGAG